MPWIRSGDKVYLARLNAVYRVIDALDTGPSLVQATIESASGARRSYAVCACCFKRVCDETELGGRLP